MTTGSKHSPKPRTRAVKRVAAEVGEDLLPALLQPAIRRVDVLPDVTVAVQLGQLIQYCHHRVEDARHLRVLVDEVQRVGHVVVLGARHMRWYGGQTSEQTWRDA